MTRRAALVLAALVLALVGCSAPAKPVVEPPGPGPAPGLAVFAFSDNTGTALVDAGGDVTRVSDAAATADGLIWSPDSQRLAWQDEPPDNDPTRAGVVHVVDRTGTEHRYPCPCKGVAFLGNDLAAFTTDGAALTIFPADGSPPRRLPLSPALPRYSHLVGSLGDSVVLAATIPEQDADFRSQYELMTVDASGSVRSRVGRSGEVSFPRGVASVPGATRFAWIDHPSGGACFADDDLRTFDAAGQTSPITPPRPSDDHMRGGLLTDGSRQIVSTSAVGTGIIVTYGPLGGCRPVYPQRLVSYLVGDPVPTYLGSGMLALAFGAQGRTARITATDPAAREHVLAVNGDTAPAAPSGLDPVTGRLDFTTADGRTSVLAAHATAMAFSPAEAAAARAVPDTPAAPSRIDTDVTGARIPPGSADLLAAIGEAAATRDTAALLELCAGCVDDSANWIRTDPAAAATLAQVAATHPIVYDPSIVVPGLAMQPCVDTNERDSTCTAEQIADAAVLGLTPGTPADFGGWDQYIATGPRGIVVEMRDENAVWTRTTFGG